MNEKVQIDILVDNPKSYTLDYIDLLIERLEAAGFQKPRFFRTLEDLKKGEILFVLSGVGMLKKRHLVLHDNNIVIHASDLPKGRGWAPWTWQIIQGANEITLTLFEAALGVDSGDVYFKDKVVLEGHELIDEIRDKIARKCVEMCVEYSKSHQSLEGLSQDSMGESSYFPRRTREDQQVQVSDSLEDIFDRLRVADYEQYPVEFEHRGFLYKIKIEKSLNNEE